jgi:hypothetical protein
MKRTLAEALKGDEFKGERIDKAARRFLQNWADSCADDPIWQKIASQARDSGLEPYRSVHSTLVFRALECRRYAVSVKGGVDTFFVERKKERARLLSLAQKAEDLAAYFEEVEKYPGTAMFFQRFLDVPVLPEQERVPRIESPLWRVQQVRLVHQNEAQVLRQLAAREPRPTTFVSRKGKRHVPAFIHLMTEAIIETCGKQHNAAVALLANMAFDLAFDQDDVRKSLAPSTQVARRLKSRAFETKKTKRMRVPNR